MTPAKATTKRQCLGLAIDITTGIQAVHDLALRIVILSPGRF